MRKTLNKLVKTYDKYVGEPYDRYQQRQQEIDSYEEQKEDSWTLRLYWFLGMLVPAFLWLITVIEWYHALFIAFIWSGVFFFYYQNKPRYCRGCSREMEKVEGRSPDCFVCDRCNTKVTI